MAGMVDFLAAWC